MKDKRITVFPLRPPGGVLAQTAQPLPILTAYCEDLEIYQSTFWAAKAAGSAIDRLVELPLHRREILAGCSCRIGHQTYTVERIQLRKDTNGLPVTWLTLKEDLHAACD